MEEYVFNIQTKCDECDHISWETRVVKFPEELDFDEDQDYIVEYLENYISTVDGDRTCENCDEVTIEYVIGYSANGYEHSLFDSSESYYRAMNLSFLTTLAPRGERMVILKAKLSKIDSNGIFYPSDCEVFLIQESHPIAKTLVSQPEEPIKINLKNFLLRKDDGNSQAYYHNDYVDWLIETS